MITAYRFTGLGPSAMAEHLAAAKRDDAGWIDLVAPTDDDNAEVEAFLGVAVPTREEAQEIETSSRFFTEDGATFLNIALLLGVEKNEPQLSPLSFVIIDQWVVTSRYQESAAFRQFHGHVVNPNSSCHAATSVVIHLTEAIIDQAADVVENVGAGVDGINTDIFGTRGERRAGKAREQKLESFLGNIAYQNDIISKVRESLVTIERMIQYLNSLGLEWSDEHGESNRLQLMARDITSLTDQLSFLSSKTTFLLDATLGLISVEQNDVIRIFTVAATILLPPTLVGTIYGMNFVNIPELGWGFGYPMAIGLMIAAGLVPYWILKKRGLF